MAGLRDEDNELIADASPFHHGRDVFTHFETLLRARAEKFWSENKLDMPKDVFLTQILLELEADLRTTVASPPYANAPLWVYKGGGLWQNIKTTTPPPPPRISQGGGDDEPPAPSTPPQVVQAAIGEAPAGARRSRILGVDAVRMPPPLAMVAPRKKARAHPPTGYFSGYGPAASGVGYAPPQAGGPQAPREGDSSSSSNSSPPLTPVPKAWFYSK